MPNHPFPLVDVLRLIRTEGVGPLTYHRLLERYDSPASALRCWSQIGGRNGIAETPCPTSQIEREIAQTRQLGADFLTLGDPDYPPLLASVPDAPPVLVCQGRREWLKKPLLAMVGSRNASVHGRKFTARLAEELGQLGYGIVSGLARGIDGAAHQAALATGTVAVVATGIDRCYPPEHRDLDARIRREGLLLTEQPLGAEPHPRAFPRRNRIVAGMAKAVLVMEAGLQSGSLITARLAADYGRDVLAVPGHPLDVRAKGCNQLLKQGAMLLEGAEDILDLYGRPEGELPLFSTPGSTPHPPLEAMAAQLLGHLSTQGIEIDELSTLCNTDTNQLLTLLLELELSGQVIRLPGGKIAKSP